MYTVTRADLPPAVQAVQSAHAAVEYAVGHPEVAGCTLVMLTVPDELALKGLVAILELWGTQTETFHEPDLGGELTAIAVSGPKAQRKLKGLPLLLREEVK